MTSNTLIRTIGPFLYFLAVVLPHEQVGLLTVYLFGDLPRSTYDAIILGLTIAIFLGFIGILRSYSKPQIVSARWILFYLTLTLLLCILSFNLLIIINIEAIHFIQYGILAILLFPLIQHYGKTLFWVTILGALDEAFQYFYLAPERTNYYDFNDVIINLIGGGFGLIFLAAQGKKEVAKSWKPELIFIGGISLILGILYSIGWFQIHPIDPETDPAFLLIRVPSEGFWTVVHPNITYHVVRPLEGLVICTILLLFYAQLPAKALKD